MGKLLKFKTLAAGIEAKGEKSSWWLQFSISTAKTAVLTVLATEIDNPKMQALRDKVIAQIFDACREFLESRKLEGV